uniref:Uncharacterized protein n=1 Tax=Arcella intermedia TaxID=1963864 RepID=A0A6B2LC59_9EUKA
MYIFGGRKSPDHPKLNDLYVINLEKMKIKKIPADSSFPSPRSDHCGAVIGHLFYIFGGSDIEINPLNDLHCYDTITKKWTQITPIPISVQTKCYFMAEKVWDTIVTTGAPAARSALRMAAVRNTLYTFGGGIRSKCVTCSAKCNEIHAFDTEKLTWRRVDYKGPQIQISSFACFIPFGDFIFIGLGSKVTGDRISSNSYVFDTITEEVIEITNLEGSPQARDGVGGVQIADKIYIFGSQIVREISTLNIKLFQQARNILQPSLT